MSENLRKLIGVAVMAAIVVVGVVATNGDDSDFARTRNVAFGLPKGAGLDAQVQQPGDAENELVIAMAAAAQRPTTKRPAAALGTVRQQPPHTDMLLPCEAAPARGCWGSSDSSSPLLFPSTSGPCRVAVDSRDNCSYSPPPMCWAELPVHGGRARAHGQQSAPTPKGP